MKSNRKEAAMRLRTRESKAVYHSSYLRSGFYLGSSTVILAYGLWQAMIKLEGPNLILAEKTNYLLQVGFLA
jgi:hypothetical protein